MEIVLGLAGMEFLVLGCLFLLFYFQCLVPNNLDIEYHQIGWNFSHEWENGLSAIMLTCAVLIKEKNIVL